MTESSSEIVMSCEQSVSCEGLTGQEPKLSSLDRMAKQESSQTVKLDFEVERLHQLVDHYQTEWRKEQKKSADTRQQCKDTVTQVRRFWRDQIYKEGSRPGIILKKAMQNSV